jgi:hypothetical protein
MPVVVLDEILYGHVRPSLRNLCTEHIVFPKSYATRAPDSRAEREFVKIFSATDTRPIAEEEKKYYLRAESFRGETVSNGPA